VIRASLYIIVCSARNRVIRRLRRLREPRYIVGAVAAGAYLLVNIFGSTRARREGAPPELPADLESILPSLVGVFLLGIAAAAWFLPSSGGGVVDFSEAEVQFLFPAPVSRRHLLVHRLMRSQIGLLFAALVPAFFFGYWNGSIAERLVRWIAIWVVFVTARSYFTGVALARGRLLAQGAVQRLPWIPLTLVFGALAIVGTTIAWDFLSSPIVGLSDAVTRLRHAVQDGPASLVLWPFAALVRPVSARSVSQFATSLLGALAVSLAAFVWVLRSDGAFQERASAVPRRPGSHARSSPSPRLRAAGWSLAPSGRTEALFFWKNGLQTLRGTSLGMLLQYGTPMILLGVTFGSLQMDEVEAQGLAAAFSTFALVVAVFVVFFGPQIMLADLRTDLRHLELLKTWPVRPADVVRGELLWPGTVVTFFGWLALACGAAFSGPAFPRWSATWRLSVAAALMLLVPALVFAQYVVQNAAVVLFPAWVPLDNERPRGLDAMGQRLILMAGVVIALALAMAPGAITGAVVWFALYRFVGIASLVPAAAVCLAVVAVEVLFVTEVLGLAYERIDVSEVERAE
jgi:ABC-2 type transport system permease protein